MRVKAGIVDMSVENFVGSVPQATSVTRKATVFVFPTAKVTERVETMAVEVPAECVTKPITIAIILKVGYARLAPLC